MSVGVVGAGITGLALCHHLAEHGVEARLFEATDRAGGVIRSTEVDGAVLEHGPQRTRLSEGVAGLVADADLEAAVIEADPDLPLFVYADGALRRVPTSLGTFLRTDLLSWPAKLRVLAEPLTAPGRDDETAAELFRRKFGAEAYESVIGPLFGGLYGSEPAEMPAAHALAPLLRLEAREGSLLKPAVGRVLSGETPPAVSFPAGLEQLPAALADRHADRVAFDAPVTAVEPADVGYALTANGERTTVDAVVLTTPASRTADVVEPLDAGTAAALRELAYNPLALVHLRADAAVEGLGYQVRADAGLATLGVTWNASAFGRDGVYTAFLGGMRDPGVVDRGPDAIGELAATEFERIVGEPAAVLGVTRLPRAMPAYDRSWAALDRVALPEGVHLATNYTGRVGIPGRVREAAALAASLAASHGA